MRRISAAGFSEQKWSGLSPGTFLSATKRPVFSSESNWEQQMKWALVSSYRDFENYSFIERVWPHVKASCFMCRCKKIGRWGPQEEPWGLMSIFLFQEVLYDRMVGPPPSRGNFDAGPTACSFKMVQCSNPGLENVERFSYSLPDHQPKLHVWIALNPVPVAASAGNYLLLCWWEVGGSNRWMPTRGTPLPMYMWSREPDPTCEERNTCSQSRLSWCNLGRNPSR